MQENCVIKKKVDVRHGALGHSKEEQDLLVKIEEIHSPSEALQVGSKFNSDQHLIMCLCAM